MAGLAALAAAPQSHAQSRVTGPASPLDSIVENATILPPGAYRIGGRIMRCGDARTIVSPEFWDYGGSMPGLIIMNPSKLSRLPRQVRLFVYHHECSHQTVGDDEAAADCRAVKRGRREGWLTPAGVKQICSRLLYDSEGDYYHWPGPARCALIDRCYADAASDTRSAGGTAEDHLARPRVDSR